MIVRSGGFLEANLTADIRRAAFHKLQTMSFSFFDRTAVGYLITRLTNDVSRITEIISWAEHRPGLGRDGHRGEPHAAMFAVNVRLALITAAAVPLLSSSPRSTSRGSS